MLDRAFSRKYIEMWSIPIPFCGCWMWLRSFGSHGYGNAHVPGIGNTVAHRVSYHAFVGPIPDGMLIQHSCDSKWCVNPDHLSIGTDATNAIDKKLKGRAARKITAEHVVSIRRELGSGVAIRRVARNHCVSQRLVQKIMRNEMWSHVQIEEEPAALSKEELDGVAEPPPF